MVQNWTIKLNLREKNNNNKSFNTRQLENFPDRLVERSLRLTNFYLTSALNERHTAGSQHYLCSVSSPSMKWPQRSEVKMSRRQEAQDSRYESISSQNQKVLSRREASWMHLLQPPVWSTIIVNTKSGQLKASDGTLCVKFFLLSSLNLLS